MAAAPVAIPPRSDTLSPQEATDLNRATLESLRDSPEAPPERASSLSPSNALFHRSKPKSGAKKSGKKRQTSRQIEAVRSNELDVVSAADEPVEGADGVLDLADELLDQLELEEGSPEPAPSESPSHSSSPLDKAGALVDSIGSKISSGFRGGSSRQAARKVRAELRRRFAERLHSASSATSARMATAGGRCATRDRRGRRHGSGGRGAESARGQARGGRPRRDRDPARRALVRRSGPSSLTMQHVRRGRGSDQLAPSGERGATGPWSGSDTPGG